jgi:hypothetical protein
VTTLRGTSIWRPGSSFTRIRASDDAGLMLEVVVADRGLTDEGVATVKIAGLSLGGRCTRWRRLCGVEPAATWQGL